MAKTEKKTDYYVVGSNEVSFPYRSVELAAQDIDWDYCGDEDQFVLQLVAVVSPEKAYKVTMV